MSYESIYTKKPPDAKGIGLTIGLHVAVAAGVMALPAITGVIKEKQRITAFPIPAKKGPVVPQVEPKEPIVDTPRFKNPTAPVPPIVDRPLFADPTYFYFPGSGEGLNFDDGAGFRAITIDPIEIIPDQVVIDAKLNTRFSKQFQPDYPTGLLRLGREGLVSVRVLVGANGRAKQIELISSSHDSFWNATRRHALKKWRFNPATKDGKPYESWITLKVRFTINS